jgi:cytochrome c oxidase assembly protein subunit 15
MLVCATFPLIWAGGLVTTTEAGMAVPDWPTTYGYNMFAYPWQTWLFGPWDLFIEHGHRLLGSLTGMVAIALCVSLWRNDPRPFARWLGVVTLLSVIGQGVLGGMRVRLDANLLAMIHGCTAPLFFALATTMAAITSRWWRDASNTNVDVAGALPLAATTSFLAYFQLLLGAQLRHVGPMTGAGSFRAMVLAHLLVAAVLTFHVLLLSWRMLRNYRGQKLLTRPTNRLAFAIVLQLLLGGGAWVLNYQWPEWLGENAWSAAHVNVQESMPQVMVTTAHVALGSVIVATSVLITLRCGRLMKRPMRAALISRSTGLGVAV